MKLKFKIVSLVLVMSLTCSPLVLAQVRTTTCKNCGNYVASTSRICPTCGKNPQYYTGSITGDFLAALFLLAIANGINNQANSHGNNYSGSRNHSSNSQHSSLSHREKYPTGITPWLLTHLQNDGKNAKRLKKNGGYTTRKRDGRTYYSYDGRYPNQIIEDRNGYPRYNLHFNTIEGANHFEKMLREQNYVRGTVSESDFLYIWYRDSDGAVIYQGSPRVDNGSLLFFFRH